MQLSDIIDHLPPPWGLSPEAMHHPNLWAEVILAPGVFLIVAHDPVRKAGAIYDSVRQTWSITTPIEAQAFAEYVSRISHDAVLISEQMNSPQESVN